MKERNEEIHDFGSLTSLVYRDFWRFAQLVNWARKGRAFSGFPLNEEGRETASLLGLGCFMAAARSVRLSTRSPIFVMVALDMSKLSGESALMGDPLGSDSLSNPGRSGSGSGVGGLVLSLLVEVTGSGSLALAFPFSGVGVAVPEVAVEAGVDEAAATSAVTVGSSFFGLSLLSVLPTLVDVEALLVGGARVMGCGL